MTLDSSSETVGILYDIENAPFGMLNYTLNKARRYQPCRTIVISDWEVHAEQKRWEKLMQRQGFTFRQIDRKFHGKNSLDYALFESAKLLYAEGVRRFFIITTDSDFVRIAEALNSGETPSYIIGVGTKQASEILRSAYDEFFCYPPEKKEARGKKLLERQEEKQKQDGIEKQEKKIGNSPRKKRAAGENLPRPAGKAEKLPKTAGKSQKTALTHKEEQQKKGEASLLLNGVLQARIPKSLQADLLRRAEEEAVSLDELVSYLLVRGMVKG